MGGGGGKHKTECFSYYITDLITSNNIERRPLLCEGIFKVLLLMQWNDWECQKKLQ